VICRCATTRRRAERLADAALEYHLLVELADARAGSAFADEEHAIQPSVGDRAGVDDRHALRAFASRHLVLQAVPRQAGTQIREVVGRIAPRQHVEHALEDRSAQLGERRGAADGAIQRVDAPVVHRNHCDDLLCEHVQRIARIADRLDLRLVHRACDGGARDEVASILGDDDAAAGLIDRVPRASDALHPARDRRRRLDLDHEIDRAHVDAEFERRGRDEAPQLSGFQPVLDLDPLRTGERSMMRAHERFAGKLVERRREPLGDPAAVHENERGAVLLDELQQARVDGGPDGGSIAAAGGAAWDVIALADARHVFDGHVDAQFEPLLLRRVHDRHVAVIRRALVCGKLVVYRSFCVLFLANRSDPDLTPL
jgi:hypothetical protein